VETQLAPIGGYGSAVVQGKRAVGGSALAQVYGQLSNDSPDVDIAQVKAAFQVTQQLLNNGAILSGHDISDGGVAVALLEMAFAGVAGISVDLPDPNNAGQAHTSAAMAALFSEDPGLVLEVPEACVEAARSAYAAVDVPCSIIGSSTDSQRCSISVGGIVCIEEATAALRDAWEVTSFRLERLQAAAPAVEAEQAGLQFLKAPLWRVGFVPEWTEPALLQRSTKPKVAILREEGSNGDREMSAAVYAAGVLRLPSVPLACLL
jgi:phosphoribosylformylglycinamidine synthase